MKSLAFLFLLSVAGFATSACGTSEEPAASTCSGDEDCFDGATCVGGTCKQESTTGASSGGGNSTTSGSTGTGSAVPVPATACLDDAKCTKDDDCPSGSHCNKALTPPQCQQLYCGGLGTICDENAYCVEGLSCSTEEDFCTPPCQPGGGSCGGFTLCCSQEGQCEQGVCCTSCIGVVTGDPGPVCAASAPLLDAVKACACGAGCGSACAEFCAGNGITGECGGCLDSNCYQQVEDCVYNY